jgi:hypothetical protein
MTRPYLAMTKHSIHGGERGANVPDHAFRRQTKPMDWCAGWRHFGGGFFCRALSH